MSSVVSALLLLVSCAAFATDAYGATSAELSAIEAEQARLANERRSLDQRQRYEVERSRLYDSQQQREQRRADAERARGQRQIHRYEPLPFASEADIEERRRRLAQTRFLEFFEFVRPALQRDDFEAVKFAAEEMRVLQEGRAFTREYYEKLRALAQE